jgi:OOP family OmpA-OmpF porin
VIAGTPLPPPPPPPPPPPEPPKPPPRVELRDNKIEFKEKIQFEVNKATIKEESFSLLHDIADVIKQNAQVKKISIEGHASADGDAKFNKKLSEDRAKSVMDYIVKKEAVDAARLTARGWGSEKPIAPNDTEEGREKNRRVEFLVVEQDVTAKKVEIDPATGKEKVIDESTSVVKAPDMGPAPTPVLTDVKPSSTDVKKKKGDKK